MNYRQASRSIFSIRFLLVHPAVWFLAATIVLGLVAAWGWDQNRDQFWGHPAFRVDRTKLITSPAPRWLDQAMEDSSNSFVADQPVLLDRELVRHSFDFFGSLPFVQAVNRIAKSGSGLEIELAFRIPIALLEPASTPAQPVDAEGVLVDSRLFHSHELNDLKQRLLRINLPMIDVANAPAWRATLDPRIGQAARLADYLSAEAGSLKLYRIVSRELPEQRTGRNVQFEVWTANGTRVAWGAAPGFEHSSEATAAQKLAAIKHWIDQNGELAGLQERNDWKIDVSSGKGVLVKAIKIATADDSSLGIK